MTEECEASKEWARHHLACRAHGGKGVAAVVHAEAQLPLSPGDAFQLMAHPDNAQIFRGIERCTFRKVLWAPCAAGRPAVGGRQTVEVENESDWHFLFFKGSIRTRMVVDEDPAAGTICVRLAPAGGTAPLQHMTGKWRFAPGSKPRSCLITLDQEVHPRGLPPFFHNGFRAVAALQVRKTFEDLYAEALRINAGRPSLAPYASVAHKEVDCQEGGSAGDATKPAERGPCRHTLPIVCEEGGADPASVLAAAYDVESSNSPPSSRGAAAAAAARTGVRSHPIGSLLDFAYLAGATSASLAAEAAASAAAAAAEAAAAAAKEAEAAALSWRTRVYGWLQRLWLASNAALGMAPDAVAQLEEMAVLV